MSEASAHFKDRDLAHHATLVVTIDRTLRSRFGVWLILLAMRLGARFAGVGWRVE